MNKAFDFISEDVKQLSSVAFGGFFVLFNNLKEPFLKISKYSNSNQIKVLDLIKNVYIDLLEDVEVYEIELLSFKYKLKDKKNG